ncbi:hypothetical protein BDZ89DRAFT_1214017 [Hymenopellis radicata]|nr:hypothetical protein BDZ89DRAFT_1214017 [Hymenopellis radicata]
MFFTTSPSFLRPFDLFLLRSFVVWPGVFYFPFDIFSRIYTSCELFPLSCVGHALIHSTVIMITTTSILVPAFLAVSTVISGVATAPLSIATRSEGSVYLWFLRQLAWHFFA